MDVRLSRAGIARSGDPHSWLSLDRYRTIHEKRLEEHPVVDLSRPNTIKFSLFESGGHEYVRCLGSVYCVDGVELAVGKVFETRRVGGVPQVRGVGYRYVAWRPGEHLILKYHNLHADPTEFHHRVYDPATGEQTGYERLTRNQFPTLSEVLDEIGLIVGGA